MSTEDPVDPDVTNLMPHDRQTPGNVAPAGRYDNRPVRSHDHVPVQYAQSESADESEA